MGAPAVVIFDVNETLSDLTPLAARFEEAGARSELLGTWFAATLRDGIALAASGSYADFRDVGRANLLQLLPTSEAAEHVLDGFAALPVHPDVPHGLRVLREARIRIATLTNGTTQIARTLLERAGLEELVEQHLDVSEVRRWKPAPDPYLYACGELGVEPAQAALLAVHPWDVHGARRAGLHGAWLDRQGLPYPEVFDPPDWSGRDLPSLARAVAAG